MLASSDGTIERLISKLQTTPLRKSVFVQAYLRRYVKVRSRRVINNVCKLHTKRVRLPVNKVAQLDKKYLLNFSVKIYQRVIRLKYRASRYFSMFSCNRPMCLYKSQTHASNYCKFQLSSDIEKNPGASPVYIDPSKTITAPYSQANGIWTKFGTTMCCNEFMLFDLQ